MLILQQIKYFLNVFVVKVLQYFLVLYNVKPIRGIYNYDKKSCNTDGQFK